MISKNKKKLNEYQEDSAPLATNNLTQNTKNAKKITPDQLKENHGNVNFYGKVARFPNGVKASNSYNYLRSMNISPNKLWYILVQHQDENLQMIKYNPKAGVHLSDFVTELKEYYLEKYENVLSPKELKLIEAITVEGEDIYTTIKGIPKIKINDVALIGIITEDLIKILRKEEQK